MPKNDLTNNHIYIVIPAFNEQNTIGKVVNNVLKIIPNIVVVDDASTDNTFSLLAKLPITTLRNKMNFGYVKSLEIGMRYAFAHGAHYVITFDADGQHLSIDLPQFVNLIKKIQPDVIFGNRSFKNRLMEKIFSIYTKYYFKVSDPFCGFRAYSKQFYTKIGKSLETHYSIGTENTFRYIITHTASVAEVNLTTTKRLDKSRFAGCVKGNLLELYSSLNLIWYLRDSK